MGKIAKIYHHTFTKKECYERNIPTVSDCNLQKITACHTGYFLTPLRNPHRLEHGFVEDFEALPEYVLIDGIEFKKTSDHAIVLNVPYKVFCAEYYRVDYEGKIKNGSGHWEEDGIIRPAYPMILKRESLYPTRVLTMKY